jgi:hypothetical protein
MPGVLDRTVNFLADRLDRRGFMVKAAVVGSAAVTAPLEFGLRPTSAYAAVCSCNGSSCACGSLCCDGYTEFCCTLSGANACPPGTLTAGWWKVDGSQFCGGAARYYLDCNAQCGACDCGANGVCSGACSGTGCGCAQGNCNNRKAGCTRFRYGQCNQGVRCVGPIVCRVVTCAPPWTFDPACGTTARTDEATRSHDRPCLNEPFGSVELVAGGDGTIQVRGWAVANSDYQTAGIRVFVDDKVAYHGTAELPRPDVRWAYPAFGPNTGYDVTIDAAPGKHLVCVWGVDRRNARTTLLGLKEIEVTGPFGSLDKVTAVPGGINIRGWLLANKALKAGRTRVFLDSTWVFDNPTDRPRPDVQRSYPGAPLNSGFQVTLPASVGKHLICVWGVDPATGARSLIDAEEVAVTQPAVSP